MNDVFLSTMKRVVRFALNFWPDNRGIPILGGPLKYSLLPKGAARENLIMLLGRYEPHVVRTLFSIANSEMVTYDVGAHVGFLTLALAKRVGRGGQVFCFEPIPGNYHLIEQLINLNNLEQVVRVIPVALGNTTCPQKMFMGESPSMYLLEAALDGQDINGCPSMMVTTLTLDAFVFEQSNPAPDILKIDVEGAEALVVQGGLRTLDVYSPKILIEIHGPRNAKKMWSLVQPLNYSWRHLTPKKQEKVSSQQKLLSYFSKDSWTHHFLLERQ